MNYEQITNNQRGFAPIALILLLLAGIGLGTYLVQNRTQLFPQAYECPEEDPDCAPPDEEQQEYVPDPEPEPQEDNGDQNGGCPDWAEPVDGGCRDTRLNDDGTLKDDQSTDQNSDVDQPGCSGPDCGEVINQCRADGGTWTGYECKQGEGAPLSQAETQENIKCASDQVTYCDGGRAIRKTGGYFDPSKGENGECVFDFFNVKEKDSECDPSKGGFDGAVVSMTAEESKLVDQQRASGQRSSDAVCPSETVCEGGKRVILYRTENVGEPGCKTTKYPTGSTEGCSGKADGTKIAGDAQADTERKLYEQGQQRIDLKGELDKAKTAAEGAGKLDAGLTALYDRANELLNQATTKYNECFTASGVNQDACTATAQIANAQAVMAARLALLEAAAKGVPNVRVKADLAVGGATNTLMEAKPSTGGGGKSRVFMLTDKDGKTVSYVVLNALGEFVPANADDLKALGLTQGADVSTIPTLFKDRIDKAQCAVDKTCADEGAVTQLPGDQPVRPPATDNIITVDKIVKDTTGTDASECGVGKTCKFWTNNQKNDGIVVYTGQRNTIIALVAPGGQVDVTIPVSASSVKTNADLNNFISESLRQANVSSILYPAWEEYKKKGGKILVPKVPYRPYDTGQAPAQNPTQQTCPGGVCP